MQFSEVVYLRPERLVSEAESPGAKAPCFRDEASRGALAEVLFTSTPPHLWRGPLSRLKSGAHDVGQILIGALTAALLTPVAYIVALSL